MAEIKIYDRHNQEILEALAAGDRARVEELLAGIMPPEEFEPIGYAVWDSVVERLGDELQEVESGESPGADRTVRRDR